MPKNTPIRIAGVTIQPGEKVEIALPISLYTQTPINVPIHIIHGKEKGPRLFVIAALHGDEINGVEIIRLLLRRTFFKKLCGTLIAIPIANVHGFINLSRYLPDRRDLNRSFPGTKRGSLAARLAHMIMSEIIQHCTHGIDIHTGGRNLENLPHIRTDVKFPAALAMARAFNAPVTLDTKLLGGSLRKAAYALDIPVLVYEGGEALRFNRLSIRLGLRGILNVMTALKMIPKSKLTLSSHFKTRVTCYSGWIRSPAAGIIYPTKPLGCIIKKNDVIGLITDPFVHKQEVLILAPVDGVIIGRNKLPLVNEGDALFHVARFKKSKTFSGKFVQFETEFEVHPDFFE